MIRKTRTSKGFSHHMILPVLALLVVGTIGLTTLRTSSAAGSYVGSCVKKTFSTSTNAKDKCVKYIQTIVGMTPDNTYGPKTKAAVKKMTGKETVGANSVAWVTICDAGKAAKSGSKYSAFKSACVKVGYKTRACTYSTPSVKTVPPSKLQCPYKVFSKKSAAQKQQSKNYKLADKYKADYLKYLDAIKIDKNGALYKNLTTEFDQRYQGAKRISAVIQQVDTATGAVL